MKIILILFTLITTLLSSPIQSSAVEVIGIAPSQKIFYEDTNGEFMCKDFSVSFPFSRVNDDFCDCSDASDEPGTSACPNGVFYCFNLGHRPKNIPSRFVNDGFCDCCDGSDEYKSPSGLLCQNTCDEEGQAQMTKLKEYEIIHQEGYKHKLDFIQLGVSKRGEKNEELIVLKEEVEKASDVMFQEEQVKNDAEEAAKAAKENHKQIVDGLKLEARQIQILSLFNELDTNGDNVVSSEELKIRPELDSNEDGVADETELITLFKEELDGGVTVEELADRWDEYQNINTAFLKRQDQVINDIKQGNETRVPRPEFENGEEPDPNSDSDYDSEPELPDEVSPSDSEEIKLEFDDETKSLIATADEAKRVYEDAKRAHDDIQNKIKNIDKFLALDLGTEHEFYPISEKCFTKDDREYTYELCPFNKVVQRPKNGGRETSLGVWGEWEHTVSRYDIMWYTKGEKCWNGPERNTQVILLCGSDSELISVDEPDRCQYSFHFRTPAACKKTLGESRLHHHDEL